jgi:SAM-dependent methyltransferase
MRCRICGSQALELFYTQGHLNQYRLYRCTQCSLVNLDLEGLNLLAHQEKYAGEDEIPVDYEKESSARQSYMFIAKYVPVRGNFMDIGCGGGGLLYFAQQDGWRVKGLELSSVLAKLVSKKLGVIVEDGDFLKYNRDEGMFDLVSLKHVLEHLTDSILTMKQISRLLKPGGYAHLEFPNINGISFRIKRLLTNTRLYRKNYPPDWQPGHCNEFSKASFEYLLGITGFSLIRWETYTSKPFMDYIYNRFHVASKARVIIRKKNL